MKEPVVDLAPPGASSPGRSRRLQRVLDEVEALFLAEGFLHLNTSDIALRLRCSKTSLYRLATTRDALFQQIVDRYVSSIRAEGRRAAEAASDWNGAIRGFLDAAVFGLRRASHAFIRDMSRFPATRERLRDHQRRRMLDAEQLIRAGVKAGAFRGVPPRILAEMLFATVGRLTEPEVMSNLGLPVSEVFEEAYRIFEYGVIPPRREVREKAREPKRSLSKELHEIWPAGE